MGDENTDPVLYGFEDDERVEVEIDTVLDRHFEGVERSDLPEVVTVHEFKPMRPEVCWRRVVEPAYEWLDDEHADPDKPYTSEYPDRVVEAAKVLAKAIEDTYVSWSCEPSGVTREVNLHAWYDERYGESRDAEG